MFRNKPFSICPSKCCFVARRCFGASLPFFQAQTAATIQRKSHRQYTTELSRFKQEYAREGTSTARRCEIRRQVSATALNTIQGVDVKTIVQYLQTAAAIQGSPLDQNVQLAVSWITMHIDAMSYQLLGDALAALQQLKYQDFPSLMDVIEPKLNAMSDRFCAGDREGCSFEAALRIADAVLYSCRLRGVASNLGKRLCQYVAVSPEIHSFSGVPVTIPLVVQFGRMSPLLRKELGGDDFVRDVQTYLDETADGSTGSLSLKNCVDALGSLVRLGHVSEPILGRICSNVDELVTAPLEVADLLFFRKIAIVAAEESESKSVKRAVVSLYELLSRVVPKITLETVGPEAFCVLFSAVVFAVKEQASLSQCSINADIVPVVIPEDFESALHRLFNSKNETSVLSTATMGRLLPALRFVPNLTSLARQIVSGRLEDLLRVVESGMSSPEFPTVVVPAEEICVLLCSETVKSYEKTVAAIAQRMPQCLASYQLYLSTLVCIGSKPAKRLMRLAAQHLQSSVKEFSPAQLSGIMALYGQAQVRDDAFCDAVVQQAAKLTRELQLHDMVIILSAMASVEYRNNRLFLDFSPIIIERCKEANAPMVANLIIAFAKMLVWNFKLFSALANRAFEVREDFSPQQMIAILTASTRMDFSHDELTLYFLGKLQEESTVSSLSVIDCAQIAIAFSQTTTRNAELFERLADRFVGAQQNMDAALLGEVLLAFARIAPRGNSHNNGESTKMAQHRLFDQLSMRIVAVAPLCPPMTVAHICQAFAMIGKEHEELFAVFSDRLRTSKDEFPAIVIGAILDAFAQLGIRDDTLFIEMIPRVRLVAQYGTPKDIANVVAAYTGVGLWHYKLFAKLADRVIVMRGQCRPTEIVKILKAYGAVKMRYDKLFLELSPRIQTLAHLLSPADVCDIIESYALVEVFESGLFTVLADRIVALQEQFEPQQWERLSVSLMPANLQNEELTKCLAAHRTATIS